MITKTLKFGILGGGAIANFHAQALTSIKDAELIGVSDVNTEGRKSFAEKYNIKPYDSYEEMLADSEIDAVCICTPSGFHKEQAVSGLMSGKHIVLEKPMALSSEDTDEITEACKKSEKILTVISQFRFSDDINRVKKLIEEGAFGNIVFCDLYMKYWRDAEYYSESNWRGTNKYDYCGPLFNQGIHGVDILLYIAGDAKVLKGRTKRIYHDVEIDDTAAAVLEFDNGALGTVEASTCAYPGFDRKIEIIGSKGHVILRENMIEKLVIDGVTEEDNREALENRSSTASNPFAMSAEGHTLQIQNFINAIHGKEKLIIDCAEGARAVRLIEDICKN